MAQMYKLYILYFAISCILPVVTIVAVLPTVLSCVAVVCYTIVRHCVCHFRSGLSATAIKEYCIVLYCTTGSGNSCIYR